MNRVPRPLVLAALLGLLVLHGAGCNRVGNANKASDAVIEITLVTYDGQSVAATTKDVTVTIQFDVVARNNSLKFPPDPDLNSVSFFAGTVTFDPPLTAFSGPVVSPNVSYPLGSSDNKMIVDVLTEPNKVALGAGTVVSGFLHFDGADMLGRPVVLETPFITALTP